MATLDDLIVAAVERAVQPLLVEVRRVAAAVDELQARVEAAPLPRYLSAEQAADIAGVTPETVRKWTRLGDLRAHRAGRLLRVRLDELEAYLTRAEPESDEHGDEREDEARLQQILRSEGL